VQWSRMPWTNNEQGRMGVGRLLDVQIQDTIRQKAQLSGTEDAGRKRDNERVADLPVLLFTLIPLILDGVPLLRLLIHIPFHHDIMVYYLEITSIFESLELSGWLERRPCSTVDVGDCTAGSDAVIRSNFTKKSMTQ
jgi:hypothetical protein